MDPAHTGPIRPTGLIPPGPERAGQGLSGPLGKVGPVTARRPTPDRSAADSSAAADRSASDRHDAAVFSALQDGPGSRPDPAEVEARRVRLLAGAQTTMNDLADVLAPLATAFGDAGHELYLVGGSVRDAVLGRLGTDLDFTTDARPETVRAILDDYADAVWDTGIEFGTLSAVKRDGGGIEQQIEITTFRADSYDGVTRNPEVVFGDTLDGDLIRRDFTVNAMAVRLHPDGRQEFVDPLNGMDALLVGVLDTPAAPEQSFSDDPLRMLRACRFVSQLGFTLAPRVFRAMAEMTG